MSEQPESNLRMKHHSVQIVTYDADAQADKNYFYPTQVRTFNDALRHSYETYLKDEWHSHDEEDMARLGYLKKALLSGRYDVNNLDDMVWDYVTMDLEFARRLQLLDVVHSDCLTADSKFGNAILYLLRTNEYQFVLLNRYWQNVDKLILSFAVSNDEEWMGLQWDIVSGITNIIRG